MNCLKILLALLFSLLTFKSFSQLSSPIPDSLWEKVKLVDEADRDSLYRSWGQAYYALRGEANMNRALNLFLGALKLARKYDHKERIYRSYFDIATVYDAQNKFKKAIEYYLLYHREQLKENDPKRVIRSAYNLATVYNKAADTTSAYHYAMIMAYNLRFIKDSISINKNILLIANILSKSGKMAEFKYYFDLLPQQMDFKDEDLGYSRLFAEAKSNYIVEFGDKEKALQPLWIELTRTQDSIPILYLIVNRLEDDKDYKTAFYSLKLLIEVSSRRMDEVSRKDLQSNLLRADNEFKERENKLLQIQSQRLQEQRLILAAISLVLAITIILLFTILRRSQRQRLQLQNNNKEIADKRDRIQTLLKEVHHRVKNNLQVIDGLLELQSLKPNRNLNETGKEIQVKLRSIALAHQMMYEQEEVSTLPIEDYLRNLYKAVSSIYDPMARNVDFEVKANCQNLPLDQIISLALIADELLINTMKHVVPNKPDCRIRILCLERGGQIQFSYSDNGPGLDPGFKNSTGIGRRLIKRLAHQLGGLLEIQSKAGLLRYVIIFKVIKSSVIPSENFNS